VIPEFVLTTMPSGSTRVIVPSLYSLPLTVLKSSESAAAAKDKSKIVKSFVCTCRLGPVQICSQISVFQSSRIAGPQNTQLTNHAVMLSEAKHLWSNPLGDSRIDPRFFDFAQNDTEIWLLVQFWTTVGFQRTSKFERAPAQCLK
jgi:hypothetical protein